MTDVDLTENLPKKNLRDHRNDMLSKCSLQLPWLGVHTAFWSKTQLLCGPPVRVSRSNPPHKQKDLENIQYTTSVYMQKHLTQMTLYDVIMSVPQDGFDAFVTKDGSDSPLFTLCSYSEPLQQPARSVSKSSNNN